MARNRSVVRSLIVAAVLGAALGACSGGGDDDRSEAAPMPTGAVLYTIGLSTDPYGDSAPAGFGVVTGIGTARQRKHERRSNDLGWFGGAEWLDDERLIVPRKAPPFQRPLIFRFDGQTLRREGVSPLPPRDVTYAWSPDGRLIASLSIGPCKRHQPSLWSCYRQLPAIYIQRADGSNRREVAKGSFRGWTPDGRLIVTDRQALRYSLLDLSSGHRAEVLDARAVGRAAGLKSASIEAPRWSADRRYVAAYVNGTWPKRPGARRPIDGLVIARADGSQVRVVNSPYLISMFAWSPRGHSLAYTTSGFPDPHELFVVDAAEGEARRLYRTGDRHFDWVAWAPDGRTLLIDDERAGRWRLFTTEGGRVRSIERLGGQPLWCCPVNSYTGLNE